MKQAQKRLMVILLRAVKWIRGHIVWVRNAIRVHTLSYIDKHVGLQAHHQVFSHLGTHAHKSFLRDPKKLGHALQVGGRGSMQLLLLRVDVCDVRHEE